MEERKMKRFSFVLNSIIAVAIVMVVDAVPLFAQGQDRANEIKSDIITLYARDPLAQAFCFRDANYGKVFQEGEVRNRCSDITYGSYRADNLSVGVEGARQGIIIDL